MTDINSITFEPDATEVDAVVIGAGFAGLYAVHKLRNDMGLNVQAFEAGGGVGGTWYWNTYPGARSDTEVTAYCYSFDRELFESWDWSERYPKQPEILSYLEHFTDRHDLRRSIRFETTVTGSRFNDDTKRWEVVTDDGRHYSAQFLIEGVGLLSSTNIPDFRGLESFEGETHHTSRWPRGGVALAGKKVGVIGTGSTGVQIITAIAPEVEHLTVFQRTPQYTVPAVHRPIDPEFLDFIRNNYKEYWDSVRSSASAFGIYESDVPHTTATHEERNAAFEEQWNKGGGFQFMLGVYNDIIVDREANASATSFIASKIKEIVHDPITAATLIPDDLYAKRPLCDDNYYATFNRDNVSLKDVKQDPIAEITTRGIRLESGDEVELDVIVFATGFDAFTGNYLKFDQFGRDGVSLRDRWSERPRAWHGLVTAEFPNWFMIFGPMCPFTNQPPAHEVHVNFIAQAIEHVRSTGAATIELDATVEDEFLKACDAMFEGTLFYETDSWINGANIPGKPKVTMVFMGGMGAHVAELNRVVESGFDVFHVEGRDAESDAQESERDTADLAETGR
jgi:cation diffusion facilitator CzcD-associated flavoprotein CzcO